MSSNNNTWNPGTTNPQAAAQTTQAPQQMPVPPLVPNQATPTAATTPLNSAQAAVPPVPPVPQPGNVNYNGTYAPARSFFGGPVASFAINNRMNEIYELLNAGLQQMATSHPQDAARYRILAMSHTADSNLGYDTIIVTCTHEAPNGRKAIAFQPLLIVNSSVDLGESKVSSMVVHGQTTTLPNKPADLVDYERSKVYASLVKTSLMSDDNCAIYMSGAVPIPEDMNLKAQGDLQNLKMLLAQALFITDLAAVCGVYGNDVNGAEPNDLLIKELVALFPNLTYTQSDRPQNVQTLTGQPVASDSRGILSATTGTNNNANPNQNQANTYYTQESVVKIQNQLQVLVSDVHIDVQFVGQDPTIQQMPQMHYNAGYAMNQQRPQTNAFVPVIQILRISTDQPQAVKPSLGQTMLGVALTTMAYGTQRGWMSAIAPTHDAGTMVDKNRHLGAMGWLLPGIGGIKPGEPVQGSFVDFNMGNPEEVSRFVDAAMQTRDRFLVTIDIEEIGEDFSIQKILLAAADTRNLEDVRKTRIDALAEICAKINLLTNNNFKKYWPDATQPIFSPMVSRMPLFYTTSGDKRRDGREWDFLRMLNKFGESNPEMLQRYTRSLYDSSFDLRSRSAETLRLLQQMLDGTPMHHHGWYQRLTFSGAFLDALCQAIKETNLMTVYNGSYRIATQMSPINTYTNLLTGGFMSSAGVNANAGFFSMGAATNNGVDASKFQQPVWGTQPIA